MDVWNVTEVAFSSFLVYYFTCTQRGRINKEKRRRKKEKMRRKKYIPPDRNIRSDGRVRQL